MIFLYTKFVMCMTVNTRAHWNLFLSLCMCALVSASAARACASVCVCVCVCERASERPRERERERERESFFEIFDMNALKMDLPPLEKAMALYQ